jgi:hypothetical protein
MENELTRLVVFVMERLVSAPIPRSRGGGLIPWAVWGPLPHRAFARKISEIQTKSPRRSFLTGHDAA